MQPIDCCVAVVVVASPISLAQTLALSFVAEGIEAPIRATDL